MSGLRQLYHQRLHRVESAITVAMPLVTAEGKDRCIEAQSHKIMSRGARGGDTRGR